MIANTSTCWCMFWVLLTFKYLKSTITDVSIFLWIGHYQDWDIDTIFKFLNTKEDSNGGIQLWSQTLKSRYLLCLHLHVMHWWLLDEKEEWLLNVQLCPIKWFSFLWVSIPIMMGFLLQPSRPSCKPMGHSSKSMCVCVCIANMMFL